MIVSLAILLTAALGLEAWLVKRLPVPKQEAHALFADRGVRGFLGALVGAHARGFGCGFFLCGGFWHFPIL